MYLQAKFIVELCYQKDVPTSTSNVKYSLYLIFAHKPEETSTSQSSDSDNGFRHLEDVGKFARSYQIHLEGSNSI
jgi:hypothetical protein